MVHTFVENHEFQAVMAENALLLRELGRLQKRITQQMAEKTAEIDKLKACLAHGLAQGWVRGWEQFAVANQPAMLANSNHHQVTSKHYF